MPEGMWIDNFGIDTILNRKILQLLGYASGGYTFTKAIKEQIATIPVV